MQPAHGEAPPQGPPLPTRGDLPDLGQGDKSNGVAGGNPSPGRDLGVPLHVVLSPFRRSTTFRNPLSYMARQALVVEVDNLFWPAWPTSPGNDCVTGRRLHLELLTTTGAEGHMPPTGAGWTVLSAYSISVLRGWAPLWTVFSSLQERLCPFSLSSSPC